MAVRVVRLVAILDRTVPVVAVPGLQALGQVENPVGAVAGSGTAA